MMDSTTKTGGPAPADAFISAPIARVAGRIRVPGDKSISHRALMLGALAEGTTHITGFLPGEDCLATLDALSALGVPIQRPEPTVVNIDGRGLYGLSAPAGPLNMGNSGTAMRLFAGVLAGQKFNSRLTGDTSLARRPMERVVAPLRLMGADIVSQDGHSPLVITGNKTLHGIDYAMPVASAQVKSAILLAGLYASGRTRVSEPATTRDHTERALEMFGVCVDREAHAFALNPGGVLTATSIRVPGDFSSAAFFMLAGCLAEEGEVMLDHVGLNPTRTGFLRILERMQANIEIQAGRETSGEPVGRVVVKPGRLRGARIPAEWVSLAIDEFPLIFVAAALAEGETVISGATELRHKESDRIRMMVNGLKALGAEVEEREDGAVIRGGRLAGGDIDSAGDHRVAMAFAVAAVAADGPITIRDTRNVATSFPGFVASARSLGMNIQTVSRRDR